MWEVGWRREMTPIQSPGGGVAGMLSLSSDLPVKCKASVKAGKDFDQLGDQRGK